MKLPFFIHDGNSKRKCDYDDLFIIAEFHLPFTIHSKRTFFLTKKLSESVFYVLYASIKAIIETNKKYPLSYMNVITIVDRYQINRIKCKSLYEMKRRPLVNLMIQLER